MPPITKPVVREIIEDFASEIRQRRTQTAKPAKGVINFRTDIRDGIERLIWRVPINLLRFRKDNGRIASDVADHERVVGPIDEKDEQGQALIAKFLLDKDPERAEVLRSSVVHAGQLEPAIITCDGFLINGNRRKMVMERLHRAHPENESFAWMKCVILPGTGDEGGPPTLLEIEKIATSFKATASPSITASTAPYQSKGRLILACHWKTSSAMIRDMRRRRPAKWKRRLGSTRSSIWTP